MDLDGERILRGIVGNPSAQYLNQLAKECGLATNYSAITHPSVPNYLAATSGSDWGIADDNPPAAHPLAHANIFSQVAAPGMTTATSSLVTAVCQGRSPCPSNRSRDGQPQPIFGRTLRSGRGEAHFARTCGVDAAGAACTSASTGPRARWGTAGGNLTNLATGP